MPQVMLYFDDASEGFGIAAGIHPIKFVEAAHVDYSVSRHILKSDTKLKPLSITFRVEHISKIITRNILKLTATRVSKGSAEVQRLSGIQIHLNEAAIKSDAIPIRIVARVTGVPICDTSSAVSPSYHTVKPHSIITSSGDVYVFFYELFREEVIECVVTPEISVYYDRAKYMCGILLKGIQPLEREIVFGISPHEPKS